jgi:hypothetical protein
MDENAQELLLVRWTGLCNEHVLVFLNWCLPILKDAGLIEPQSGFVLNLLGLSCHTTGESALLLTRFGRVGDAEIVLRSVLEGTAKYLFLCTQDPSTRAERVEEYWNLLPEFDRLKRHERIAQFRSVIGDMSPSADTLRELLLSEEEAARLRAAYPRKQRQALAQRWSFTEIIRALALEIPGREAVGMLAHAYGASSHTTHQDADGTAMIWERLRRGDERRELIHLAHASRQVRDVFTFAMLRAIATYRIAQCDINPIKEFWAAQTPFLDELTEAERAWWAVERQYSPPTYQPAPDAPE